MKKLLLLFAAVMLLFSSCEGPAGRDGLDGLEPFWFSEVYTVNSNQWKLVNGVNNLGSYYKAEINVPKLDKEIYEQGIVQCYMFMNNDGKEVQTPLFTSMPQGMVNKNGEYLWQDIYTYDFSVGKVFIYCYYSDFMTENVPPTSSFRIVLH